LAVFLRRDSARGGRDFWNVEHANVLLQESPDSPVNLRLVERPFDRRWGETNRQDAESAKVHRAPLAGEPE